VMDGPGSSYLHTVEPGAIIKAIGPQGFFTRPLTKSTASLFVATGTGVTPFRSMIREAIAARAETPLWLLFGVRHEQDLLYREELVGLAKEHPHIRVELTLSQPPPTWTGRRGYVQTHVKELLGELDAISGGTTHTYICGLQKMVGSVRELLRKEMGLPRERVHTERYD
jgi:CDP-4-dehydro-6-deoxyglucose reductase